MDDTLTCPICGNRLRTKNLSDHNLYFVENKANYVERTCTTGMNHCLQLFSEDPSKKIHLLKIALNPQYSRFIEIDLLNSKSRIICFKFGKPEYINIPNLIEPDFPDLIKLKEKVALYIAFL